MFHPAPAVPDVPVTRDEFLSLSSGSSAQEATAPPTDRRAQPACQHARQQSQNNNAALTSSSSNSASQPRTAPNHSMRARSLVAGSMSISHEAFLESTVERSPYNTGLFWWLGSCTGDDSVVPSSVTQQRCCLGCIESCVCFPCTVTAQHRFLREGPPAVDDDGHVRSGHPWWTPTCLLATALPCAALVAGARNRTLMALYHRIGPDPDESCAVCCPALICPCCSAAQVGRELELRGVGGPARGLAPPKQTMDDSRTPSDTSQQPPPTTEVHSHAAAGKDASPSSRTWIPFYPDAAGRARMAELSTEYWRHATVTPNHRTSSSSAAGQTAMEQPSSSPRDGARRHTAAGSTRHSVSPTTANRLPNPLASPRDVQADDTSRNAAHQQLNHLSVLLGYTPTPQDAASPMRLEHGTGQRR